MKKQEKKKLLNNKWFALFLIFLPTMVLAFDFGEVKLYSYINEPLDAEIELLGAENYDPEHIIVSLASDQEFKRAELERASLLSQLQFQPLRTDSKTVIRITSSEPISEPYLEFLLNSSWPEGRLVKGYTVLLDPAAPGTPPLSERRTPPPQITKSTQDIALIDATPDAHQPNFEKLFDENLETQSGEKPTMTIISMASTRDSFPKIELFPKNWLIIPSSELLATKLPGVEIQTPAEQYVALSAQYDAQSISQPTSNSPILPLPLFSKETTSQVAHPSSESPSSENASSKSNQIILAKNLNSKLPFSLDKTNWKMMSIAFAILMLFAMLMVRLARRKKIKMNDIPPVDYPHISELGYPSEPSHSIMETPSTLAAEITSNLDNKVDHVNKVQEDLTSDDLKLNVPLPHEMSMKIELSRHYMDIGDNENAFVLLEDVALRGSDWEKQAAQRLLLDARNSANKS